VNGSASSLRHLWVEEVLARLRGGHPVSDATFDRIFFPTQTRRVSRSFWTPVDVARRAIELLAPAGAVLDIGSGIGKLCLLGAALTDARFVGVEHRAHFVRTAEEAALRAGLSRVEFVHADFRAMDLRSFQGIYLYNPFDENRWPRADHLDDSIVMSENKFFDDVLALEGRLDAARAGTRVVTYHGFGGRMPDAFRHVLKARSGSGYLELWVKH